MGKRVCTGCGRGAEVLDQDGRCAACAARKATAAGLSGADDIAGRILDRARAVSASASPARRVDAPPSHPQALPPRQPAPPPVHEPGTGGLTFRTRHARLTGTAPARADASGVSGGAPTRAAIEGLDVEVDYHDRLCYALAHAGVPVVERVRVTSRAGTPLRGLRLRLTVDPPCVAPWERTLPELPPAGGSWDSGAIPFVPLAERLREQHERGPGQLRVEVLRGLATCFVDTVPLHVLAYNEWFARLPGQEDGLQHELALLLALFVTPNAPAVEELLPLVRDELRGADLSEALEGYQAGDPERVRDQVEAVFQVLRTRLDVGYAMPPASFEPTGQKVRLPAEVLARRHGTCLDLAVLFASVLEQAGLRPFIVLMPGHAFSAVALREGEEAVAGPEELAAGVADGSLLAFNSTNACHPEGSLDAAVAEAEPFMEQVECVVDVAQARGLGLTPAF